MGVPKNMAAGMVRRSSRSAARASRPPLGAGQALIIWAPHAGILCYVDSYDDATEFWNNMLRSTPSFVRGVFDGAINRKARAKNLAHELSPAASRPEPGAARLPVARRDEGHRRRRGEGHGRQAAGAFRSTCRRPTRRQDSRRPAGDTTAATPPPPAPANDTAAAAVARRAAGLRRSAGAPSGTAPVTDAPPMRRASGRRRPPPHPVDANAPVPRPVVDPNAPVPRGVDPNAPVPRWSIPTRPRPTRR
jgi:hypothetical protein